MSDLYGWRIYEPDGVTVRSDASVIMSKRLGSYTMPVGNSTAEIVIPVDFQGGIPFAFICSQDGVARPSDSVLISAVPNVRCTSNSVIISINNRQASYPDDLGFRKVWGGFIVHWGVYFADVEQGGIYT